MLNLTITRRGFIGTASAAAAVASVPIAGHLAQAGPTSMILSAERGLPFSLSAGSVVLEGERLARLQTMAKALAKAGNDVVLRLDATDDKLLDIAAQQAGVSVIRGEALPDGLGIRAQVTNFQRNFA